MRDRARRWEVRHLESSPWKALMTDHFVLRSDSPHSEMRLLGVHAELAFDALQESLGAGAATPPLPIRIHSQKEEFNLLASLSGAEGAASYYDPSRGEAVIRRDATQPREMTLRLLRHEVAHLYMHRVFGLEEPLWLCEGVAEWTEHAGWRNGLLVPGMDAPDRSTTLRQALAGGTFPPLSRLLGADRNDFYSSVDGDLFYAQAWSLVRFLAGEPGRLRRLMMGERGIGGLEEAWRDSIRTDW